MGNKSDRMSFYAFDEESENFIVLMNKLKGKQETGPLVSPILPSGQDFRSNDNSHRA